MFQPEATVERVYIEGNSMEKTGKVNKKEWNHILVYAQQEKGAIHPVGHKLIGEAHKLAANVDYEVSSCSSYYR